ncbi:INO80 complex subunit B isoform X1 [Alosa pseudoharengus]|uniref:INO80 complex subunit B isoform X1 n=1 Tax=Alosa pseudoharengus TaxID=34774 RepID=UPI003F8C1924
MGKRKDMMIHPRYLIGDRDEVGVFNAHRKKHKKHKKHKKKHHREESYSPDESDSGLPIIIKPPQLKLKIKLGGQTLGTKSVPTFSVVSEAPRSPSPLMIVDDDGDDDDDDDDDDDEDDDDEPSEGVPIEQYRAWLDEDSNLEPSCLGELDSSSLLGPVDEEERWLEALEKGELDDNGELKKEIDESLLTARQKALLHKQQSQPLLELPIGLQVKEPTAEMLRKREERARQRRLQAARKAEESKNQTIERLTKTSNKAKVRSGVRCDRERRGKHHVHAQVPTVCYRSSATHGASISFPVGVQAPEHAPPRPAPPPRPSCGVDGCPNPKRYACSKTGVPLCSLECYKRNLQIQMPQMVA